MTSAHANPEDLDLYALGALDGEDKQALEVASPRLPALPAAAGGGAAANGAGGPGSACGNSASAGKVGADGQGAGREAFPKRADQFR